MQILKGPRKAVFNMAFSADGRRLAVGGWGWLNVWGLGAGAVEYSWALASFCGGLAFSPDGRLLALTDCRSYPPELYDLSVWRLAAPAAPAEAVLRSKGDGMACVWFHPGGSWLLAQGDNSLLTRWDTTTWERRVLWDNRHGWDGDKFSQVHVSPDARALLRQVRSDLELYDLDSGELIRRAECGGGRGAFLPDSRRFVLPCGNELIVFDLAEGKEVVRRQSGRKRLSYLAASPDGRWVLTAADKSKVVQLWSTTDWREGPAYTWPIGEVRCLAVAPDGQRAAAGGSGGQVVVWDLDL
jgi:WD40 repeat protein